MVVCHTCSHFYTSICLLYIVLSVLSYVQPGSQPDPPDSNGSTKHQENSKYEQFNMAFIFLLSVICSSKDAKVTVVVLSKIQGFLHKMLKKNLIGKKNK